MKVLITGSAGFIGSNLSQYLRATGHETIGVDLKNDQRCQISFQGDLASDRLLEEIFKHPIDAIIHLAGKTRVIESVDHPQSYFKNNVIVTEKLLNWAKERQVRYFIFASTNAVVGNVENNLISEDLPLKPLTPYGATKAAAEALITGWANSYGFNYGILRLTNVFGPSMLLKDSFIPRLIKSAVNDEPITVYGDGCQSRDFVSVGSVCYAINEILKKNDFHEVVIIGKGESISVNELITRFEQATRQSLRKIYVDQNFHEMPHVKVSIDKARRLGLYKDFEFNKELKSTYEDFLSALASK